MFDFERLCIGFERQGFLAPSWRGESAVFDANGVSELVHRFQSLRGARDGGNGLQRIRTYARLANDGDLKQGFFQGTVLKLNESHFDRVRLYDVISFTMRNFFPIFWSMTLRVYTKKRELSSSANIQWSKFHKACHSSAFIFRFFELLFYRQISTVTIERDYSKPVRYMNSVFLRSDQYLPLLMPAAVKRPQNVRIKQEFDIFCHVRELVGTTWL